MSKDINVTDGTVLETLNNKVDLDGGNYAGSPLEEYIHEHCGANTDLSNLSEIGQAKFDEKVNKSGDTMTGTLTITEMSDGYCQQRFVNGNYGLMFRQDSSNFYMLISNKNDPYGNWNDLRPFSINLSTGEFLFTKSSQPATTTSSANAGKPAVIIYNYRNGESWIRKWSDGWIEQGGFVGRSGNTTTISLLTAHSNTNFNVQVTMAAGTGNRYAASIVNRATNSFQVYCVHTEPVYFWRTCGY